MTTVNTGLSGYNGSHTDGSYGLQNDTKIKMEQTTYNFLDGHDGERKCQPNRNGRHIWHKQV